MAEPVSVADQALKKLADQLECSICLNSFTDAKLLQCFHVFCKDCLEPLVLRNQHGLLLRCPNCRRSTLIPANGVSGLQPAFHVHHLFEIKDALQKVKQGQEGQKIKCEKCKKREVNGFCRDCGKFVCEVCMEIHQMWEEYSNHKVIGLEQFVSDCLKTGSEGEILAMEKPVVQQVKEMYAEFDTSKLAPHKQADMALTVSSELLPACQQFGQVRSGVCPEKCYATGKGLEVATVGKQSTMTVHAIDIQDSKCAKPLPLISSELVASSGERMKCEVKPSKSSEYQVDYRPTRRGRHQLHIKVCDQHIRGSPFTVVALRKLAAPTRTITGLNDPWGVEVDKRGQVIISEWDGHCISVYSSGKRIRSFGQKGSSPGQFHYPCGVAVDRAGNTLVVDTGNHRIQKFTAEGKFMALVGSEGDKPLQFSYPVGIGISPSEKVYVCDNNNHRVQILNPDLSFSTSFRSLGNSSCEVAFDSRGNVYVADSENHRIQVFTEGGRFLRKFGKKGGGDGELNYPVSVAIDSDDVVYVTESKNHRISLFTSEGHFLKSFGTQGEEPGQFNQPRGIAVDKDGLVYVCDSTRYGRLQIL